VAKQPNVLNQCILFLCLFLISRQVQDGSKVHGKRNSTTSSAGGLVHRRRQFWLSTFLVLSGLVFACQFLPVGSSVRTIHRAFPPRRNYIGNPQVDAILHRSCEACHSSEATLPWYGHVAPVSWLVLSHVNRGIEKWDLALWEERAPLHGEKEDMCDSITDHSMPLRSYTWVHPKAKLSKHDIEVLCIWADTSAPATSATK
jgi:hypothetical protein